MPLPVIPQVWERMRFTLFALTQAFLSLVIVVVLFPECGAAFAPPATSLQLKPLTAKLPFAPTPVQFHASRKSFGEFSKHSCVVMKALNSEVETTTSNDAKDVATLDELQEAANRIGMYFTMTWLGPVYRCVIRKLPEEGEEKGKAIGFTTGSIIGSLIRQDTMRISNVNSGNELSKKRPDEIADRGWQSPHVLGLGILLGAYPLRVAYDQGVKTAQLLAICDEERQFKILRRHYMRLGLKPIKELTDDITCVPDRMIWGGVGTLMEADVTQILSRHTQELKKIGAQD